MAWQLQLGLFVFATDRRSTHFAKQKDSFFANAPTKICEIK